MLSENSLSKLSKILTVHTQLVGPSLTSSNAIWKERPEGVVSVPLSPASPPSVFCLAGGCGLGDNTGDVDDKVS